MERIWHVSHTHSATIDLPCTGRPAGGTSNGDETYRRSDEDGTWNVSRHDTRGLLNEFPFAPFIFLSHWERTRSLSSAAFQVRRSGSKGSGRAGGKGAGWTNGIVDRITGTFSARAFWDFPHACIRFLHLFLHRGFVFKGREGTHIIRPRGVQDNLCIYGGAHAFPPKSFGLSVIDSHGSRQRNDESYNIKARERATWPCIVNYQLSRPGISCMCVLLPCDDCMPIQP